MVKHYCQYLPVFNFFYISDAQFLEELLDKYDTLRKNGIITAEKINLPQYVNENLADSDYVGTEENYAEPLHELFDAGNGEVGDKVGNQNDQLSEIWNENETKLLINLYGEHVDDFKHAKKKKHVWVIISEKMSSKGIHKSAEKCQRKWINLTRVYRSVKDNSGPRKTGRGRIFYRYFNALDEILGQRPSNSIDTYIFDAGASTSLTQETDEEPHPSTVSGSENNVQEQKDEDSANMTARKRKNYIQEYFKKKLENGEREREMKRLRYEEKMDIERKRNDLEEQKINLLKQVLLKLNKDM